MPENLAITATDRVLIAAPHPDDESIATGGLLQVTRDAGAACRVLLVTDGDNNPWPQRWVEKRWSIGAAERARWGARRRGEAIAALRVLGVDPDAARCLGLPDLGLTDALMRGSPDVVAQLRAHLEEFQPTHVFLPALEDRHPDHSALHVLLRIALAQCSGTKPLLLTFGVHGTVPAAGGVMVNLGEAERQIKRAAIEAHATQMRFSRNRFVAYARAEEPFRAEPWLATPDAEHPLSARVDVEGELRVRLDRRRWPHSLRGQALYVVALTASGSVLCRLIALSGGAAGNARDTRMPPASGQASIEQDSTGWNLCLGLGERVSCGWVKVARPAPGWLVFDRRGWQTLVCGAT